MKIKSLFFATLFLLETVAGPGAAASTLPHSSTGAPPTSPHLTSHFQSRGWIHVPSTLASTLEVYAPVHSERLVYHLQDVHEDIPSQVNLLEIIGVLEAAAASQGKSLVVAVEGASGDIESDSVAILPDQRNKQLVGIGLLKAGYLFGEEVAAITHAPGRIKIIGIEDAALYTANQAAKVNSFGARVHTLNEIRKIRRQLEALRDHNFNSTLADLEKNRIEVENDRLPLSTYVTFLNGIDPSLTKNYPSVAGFLHVLQLERKIDFDQVDRERKEITNAVMKEISEEKAEVMVKQATAFREGRMSALAYYAALLAQAKKPVPAMEFYVSYLKKAELVAGDAVFDELTNLEIRIAQKLLRHPVAATLYGHLRWIETQERFFSLHMLPQEWEQHRHYSEELIAGKLSEMEAFISEQASDIGYKYAPAALSDSELTSAVMASREFYRLAEERNGALMENFSRVLTRFSKDRFVPIIIAGGFHTPGLSKLMRSQRLAYAVLRPQAEVSVALPPGYDYPVFRNQNQEVTSGSFDFLRSQGGLSFPGGLGFVRDLITSSSHRLPPSGWPVKSQANSIQGSGRWGRALLTAWNMLKTSFPTLKWLDRPVERRETSYVSSTLPALTGAVGENVQRFGDGLGKILSAPPVKVEMATYIAIDADSFENGDVWTQGDKLLRLFINLNAKASQMFVPNAHVVFFSADAGSPEFQRLIALANKQSKGVSFSFVTTGSKDLKTILTSARIPAANISEDRSFIFSMGSRVYENKQAVNILGIPHLALATFAYSHYQEADSVLSQLVHLFEAFTSLRMNGSLNDRIMAELISKIAA